MLTKDSWFMRVSEKIKMRCMQELAHVKYVPSLNLKTTEQTHHDHEFLKKQKLHKDDYDAYYFNIVEEISNFLYH